MCALPAFVGRVDETRPAWWPEIIFEIKPECVPRVSSKFRMISPLAQNVHLNGRHPGLNRSRQGACPLLACSYDGTASGVT